MTSQSGQFVNRPVVVIGAGVIGLTTAITALEAGHRPVHVLADHLPRDPLTPTYASTIAGAHHLSFADDADERQTRWDWRTFEVFHNEWRRDDEKSGLMRLTQTELWVGSSSHLKVYERHPDFKVIDPAGVGCPCDHAVQFTSFTITPAIYLDRLVDRFLALGGKIHRAHVASLDAAAAHIAAVCGKVPRAVFVCVGLRARDLGGVADKTVFPTRGQVVAVRAPWMKRGTTRQAGSLDGGEGGSRTYVIPRVTGQVILGGTREVDDWEPAPRADTSNDILTRVLEICPDIVPPGHSAASPLEALRGIVTNHVVGFRPSRTNGVRLEREDRTVEGERVAIVHNYGHGGAGWQSSWGTAEEAVALLGESYKPRL